MDKADVLVNKINYHFIQDILGKSEVPLIVTDSDGVIKYISDYITSTITESSEWINGRLIFDFLENVYNYQNRESLKMSFINQGDFEDNIVYTNNKKQLIHYKLTLRPIRENNEVVAFAVIFKDETDKKALEIAREDAKKAKDGFLTNMSHEIKTPMNAIVGLTNLLDKTVLNSKQKDYVNKISSSGKKLTRIINDILDYSNIERGQIKFENYSFSLDELLDSIADVMGHEAFEKGIEFVISKNPYLPPYIIGDPLRMDQVLINLIGNAIKFTKQGQVTLRVDEVTRSNDSIVLSFAIQDTGKGMTDEEKDLMFSVFSKGDASITRKHEGIGLGLTIVQGLLSQLDSGITVESELGKGSTFSFNLEFKISTEEESIEDELPDSLIDLKVAVVDDNTVAREVVVNYLNKLNTKPRTYKNGYNLINDMKNGTEYDLVILDYKMPEIDGIEIVKEIENNHSILKPKFIMVTAYPCEELYEQAETHGIERVIMKPTSQSQLYNNINQIFDVETTKPSQGVYYDGAKLLLVEDNLINQQVAIELLEQRGFTIDVANNGLEAVDLVEKNGLQYSMVLMDLQMPEMDGYTASEIIRKTYESFELPIIAVSANLKEEVLSRVIDLDMQDYVSKPIEPKVLFDAIERWINPMFIVLRDEVSSEEESSGWDKLQSMMPSFDINTAKNRISNNFELYKKLLGKFVNSNKETAIELERHLIANDRTNAEMVAHTIKGVAGNIGANGLYETSKELEFLSKDYSVVLSQVANSLAFEQFKIELDRALFEIENLNLNGSDNTTGGNSNIPKDVLVGKLNELIELLDDFDTDAEEIYEEIKASIESLGYKEQSNAIESSIGNYDFDEAKDKASEILEGIK